MITQLEVTELFTIDLPGIIGDDTNGHIDNYVRFIAMIRLCILHQKIRAIATMTLPMN